MHGLEKEGIRTNKDGLLSLTPHPAGLGSSLTHPFITTDFTESQLELRTHPSEKLHLALQRLDQIHIYTAEGIGEELIWPLSMPPRLPEKESQIPLAQFGTSPAGEKKTIYRRGIGLRYGRRRLTLSGVHYNFSIDVSPIGLELLEALGCGIASSLSDAYFHIARNLHRQRSYFTYLFGASPAIDKSFAPQPTNGLKLHQRSTLYSPFATSLRLSEIGYTSKVQDALPISYDSLDAYVRDLASAMNTCNPDYLALSAGAGDQLNANYLQVEQELYSPFRIQQETQPGESLLDVLKQRGPGYIEIRMLDIDPEGPGGVDPYALGFLHMAMLDCLMRPSPPVSATEWQELQGAQHEVVWRGREKGLKIIIDGSRVSFHQRGKRYCEAMAPLAEKMDEHDGSDFYRTSLSRQVEKWIFPERTPSGKQLAELLDNGKEFVEWGLEIAQRNAQRLKAGERDLDFQAEIKIQTERSKETQREIEQREDSVAG